MRILYIHQYFDTPEEGGATRSYWISRALIEQGHEVTMLTTSNDKYDSGHEEIDGIAVAYIYVPYNSNMGILQRLNSFFRFMVLSALYVLRCKNVDLIIATSTPLTVGFPALMGKKIKKIPYIFEVRDLWPEVPIQMGVLKNRIAIRFTRWFEKTIYKNARHIIALSPGMEDGVVSTGISGEKVTMIPNMSKIDIFWPRAKNHNLMKELKLSPETFKVVYFGSMGLANGMDYILDAAKVLGNDKDIDFIFLGGGPTEEGLRERCKEEQLENVHFLGSAVAQRLSEIVNFCDASLITFANLPILATNSPNKFFDSLSAGKPLIVNSPGWTKDIVTQYQCGIFVDPEKPEAMAEELLLLKSDHQRCEQMGTNSRILAEKKYDKSILCQQYVEVVAGLEK